LELICQRCNETLREQDRYCATCGLPQLLFVAPDGVVLSVSEESDGREAANQGSTHGSTHASTLGSASGIAWRPALKAAIVLAIPASLLCSALSGIGLVFMAGASAWAVNLYARRIRASSISTGAGARIGLVTGLLAGWMTLGLSAAFIWSSRFLFHQSAQMDSSWLSQVEQALQIDKSLFSQMGVSSAQVTEQLQLQRAFMLSAEGRVCIQLFSLLASTLFLVLFAVISGAISARFLTSSNRKRT